MSRRVAAEGHTRDSSGRTPSKLRRTAVVAVDGVLAVGTGALAGLFATGPASATVPTPGWTGAAVPGPFGLDAPATNPDEASRPTPARLRSPAPPRALHGHRVQHPRDPRPLSGGTWSAVEAPLPSDANGEPRPVLLRHRLPGRAARAIAVGGYKNNSGGSGSHPDGLIETLSGGVWNATEAPVPSDAAPATGSDTWLKSVSCPAPGDCVAVGFYSPGPSTSSGSSRRSPAGNGPPCRPRRSPTPTPIRPSSWPACRAPPSGSCVADGLYETNAGGTGLELLTDCRAAPGRRRWPRCRPTPRPGAARGCSSARSRRTSARTSRAPERCARSPASTAPRRAARPASCSTSPGPPGRRRRLPCPGTPDPALPRRSRCSTRRAGSTASAWRWATSVTRRATPTPHRDGLRQRRHQRTGGAAARRRRDGHQRRLQPHRRVLPVVDRLHGRRRLRQQHQFGAHRRPHRHALGHHLDRAGGTGAVQRGHGSRPRRATCRRCPAVAAARASRPGPSSTPATSSACSTRTPRRRATGPTPPMAGSSPTAMPSSTAQWVGST